MARASRQRCADLATAKEVGLSCRDSIIFTVSGILLTAVTLDSLGVFH
ncbi:MAG: hypothetical protein QOJ04_7009 [Caballeronia sp.]|nr:hypothetical protein [Caballeronia sp.]